VISESGNREQGSEGRGDEPQWSFLTNHARVLLAVAHDADIRLRDIGDTVGITERAAHRIVGELAAAGYLMRERNGRRNRYTVNSHLPLPDPLARSKRVGDLLEVLASEQVAVPT
jgi:MarR family